MAGERKQAGTKRATSAGVAAVQASAIPPASVLASSTVVGFIFQLPAMKGFLASRLMKSSRFLVKPNVDVKPKAGADPMRPARTAAAKSFILPSEGPSD